MTDRVQKSRDYARTIDLRPCVTCQDGGAVGFNERMRNATEIRNGTYRGYIVTCFRCGSQSKEGTAVEAAADWNGEGAVH